MILKTIINNVLKVEDVKYACSCCGYWPLLTMKTTKKRGDELVCPHTPCDFTMPYDKPSEAS